MQIILATSYHIDQIISLNRKYLITQLSNEQLQNGFIRIAYNREEFEIIIENKEIVIAVDNEMIVGYFLIGRMSGNPALEQQKNKAIDLINTFNISFDKIGFGCQVCIENEYRNIGLSRQLLNFLLTYLDVKYSYLLSTISNENLTSLQNSTKIGWEILEPKSNYYIYKIQ
jgi:hypothetical protein